MIVIRRLIVTATTAALLAGASACSALVGPSHDDAVDDRITELVEVMGAEEARSLETSERVVVNGETLYNDKGYGLYYAMFGDDCWTTVVYGRLNENGEVEYGWAGVPNDEEGEGTTGQQPIDNADDMAAFAAESCANTTVTTDSP